MAENTTHKFVLAIHKRAPEGDVLKLAAAVAAALSARAGTADREAMRFLAFVDGDGGVHPMISALSLIVMRGSGADLQKLSASASAEGLLVASVVRGQVASMASDDRPDESVAVMAFGEKSRLDPLTRKLSLWR